MMQRACRPTSLESPETSLMDVAGLASPPSPSVGYPVETQRSPYSDYFGGRAAGPIIRAGAFPAFAGLGGGIARASLQSAEYSFALAVECRPLCLGWRLADLFDQRGFDLLAVFW